MPVAQIVLAGLVGFGVWFWVFGLAFTRSVQALYADLPGPLIAELCAAAVLAFVFPSAAKAIAISMAATTVVLNAAFIAAALSEGKEASWSIIVVSLAVAGTPALGVSAGWLLRRWRDTSDPDTSEHR